MNETTEHPIALNDAPRDDVIGGALPRAGHGMLTARTGARDVVRRDPQG